QGLLDEQAAEPRTVDEQLAVDDLPARELHGFDEAILAAQLGRYDLAFGTTYAALLGVFAQVLCVQARVEVDRPREVRPPLGLAFPGRQVRQRIRADVVRFPALEQLEPVLVERNVSQVFAED